LYIYFGVRNLKILKRNIWARRWSRGDDKWGFGKRWRVGGGQ